MKNDTASLGLDSLSRRALLAVYELSSLDKKADAASVAQALGITSSEAIVVLLELDKRGLLWAERCKLTMSGLATAARLSAMRNSMKWRAA